MDDTFLLRAGRLEATVARFGAELISLRHAAHGELLWQGDPHWWDRRSPILFPTVGRSRGDRIRVGDATFPMPMHGFAHSETFDVEASSETACRLTISDSDATRAQYPFAFGLALDYRLEEDGLTVEATIGNPGGKELPACFGFHPGFAWPLQAGLEKTAHFIEFADDTSIGVQRAVDGAILPEVTRMPLDGRRLWLDAALFAEGAMVLLSLASRRVTFGAAGAAFGIEVGFRTLPMLGLWMRPGADFLCVEPWSGHGDAPGFAGQMADKPGVALIAPGAEIRHRMTLRIVG